MGSLTKTTRAILALFSSPGTTLKQLQPNPALGTAKITKMPLPAKDQVTKDVREVTFPMFSSLGVPALEEVKQAPSIANCPVAAILAAHAFTAVGRTLIQGILSTTQGTVLTDLSALPPNTLANPPQGNTVSSSRYFTVKLSGGSIDVSDVFYTNDADSGWSLIYLHDPSDKSIWAAIVEKALAVKLDGNYESFMVLDLSANDYWEKITGVLPTGFDVLPNTSLTKIMDAANDSKLVPTIGASKNDSTDVNFVDPFHGYAMIGMQGSKIHLYDPAKAKKILLSPADFRHDFKAILHRA